MLRRPIEFAQYTSIAYTERLAEIGAAPSIGTVGDSFDNALAESVNALFKTELYRNWQINQPLFDGRGKWRQMTEEEKRLVKAKAYGMLAELGYGAQADW